MRARLPAPRSMIRAAAVPPDHPLLERESVLLTPHLAGITRESMERMGVGARARRYGCLNGELPENLINPEAVPAYRERFGG